MRTSSSRLLVVLSSFILACGARTALPVDAGSDSTQDGVTADQGDGILPDVPGPDVGDTGFRCHSDGDCAGTPATPVCNVGSGMCVPGCVSDANCHAPTPRCSLSTRQCVACLGDGDCPFGDVCSNFMCVSTCGGGSGCTAPQTCCTGVCDDTSSDPNNCGLCRHACAPVANGTVACAAGSCAIGTCNPGFGDCNGVESDGCEVNVLTDPNHCGACGTVCGANQVCSNGTCVAAMCMFHCPPNLSCCSNGCFDETSDSNNCGGCGHQCGAGERCSASMCVPAMCPGTPCAAGSNCCGGTCISNNDPNNCGACGVSCQSGEVCMMGACCVPPNGPCGAMVCSGGQTNCGGTCVDLNTNNSDCGACFIACGPGQTCVSGHCTGGGCATTMCAPGQTCCPSTNGCTNLTTDPNNCGGCGIVCTMGPCINSMCVSPTCNGGPICPPPLSCCSTGCVDLQGDDGNCGTCNRACPTPPNTTEACTAGTCTVTGCAAGWADCNGSTQTGCSTNTSNDPRNCGACGHACAAGAMCTGGVCGPPGCGSGGPCTTGQTCCGAACANTNTDPNNCGSCGTVCSLPHAMAGCSGGQCTVASCVAPFANCDGIASNGCESNTSSDPNNCGVCGMICAAGDTCSAGVCTPISTGSEGAFDPVANPTYLSPGVHNFTTITVPAGAVVYVAGGGALSGTLDLRATGHVQIDGTIDVSGGPGTQSIVASTTTQNGHAGSGGDTGTPQSVAQSVAACQFVAGNPGIDGSGAVGTNGTCTVISTSVCLTTMDPQSFIWASPAAQFGGGAGVFTGYRAYGSGGGGPAGGAPGALGAAYRGEMDCSGVTGGGGASGGQGGSASSPVYNGVAGNLGTTQCPGTMPGISNAYVGGGGGGSIGAAAASDLAVSGSFIPGSGGGGGSADYLNRPAFGGTSGGGGGGGALRLWTSADIVVNGQLLANGGNGGDAYIGTPSGANCDPQPGAGGGGGSGGVIVLNAPSVTTAAGAVLSAHGGTGGQASVFAMGGSGGDGGLGRIRVSVTPATCALGGMFNPPVSGCAPSGSVAGQTYVGTYPN